MTQNYLGGGGFTLSQFFMWQRRVGKMELSYFWIPTSILSPGQICYFYPQHKEYCFKKEEEKKKSGEIYLVSWEIWDLNSEVPSTIRFLKPEKEKKSCLVSEDLKFQRGTDFLRLWNKRKGSLADGSVCLQPKWVVPNHCERLGSSRSWHLCRFGILWREVPWGLNSNPQLRDMQTNIKAPLS